jgi:hypothetical protein
LWTQEGWWGRDAKTRKPLKVPQAPLATEYASTYKKALTKATKIMKTHSTNYFPRRPIARRQPVYLRMRKRLGKPPLHQEQTHKGHYEDVWECGCARIYRSSYQDEKCSPCNPHYRQKIFADLPITNK